MFYYLVFHYKNNNVTGYLLFYCYICDNISFILKYEYNVKYFKRLGELESSKNKFLTIFINKFDRGSVIYSKINSYKMLNKLQS